MDFDMVFTGISVGDLPAAVLWYAAFIGREPDVPVNEDEVMWQFTDSAFLYVVRDLENTGRSVVTLSVADIDVAIAEAASRGVAGGPVTAVGTAGRRAVYTDPAGNRVALVEVNQPTRG
jgi:predicted enzyme related to lactoylglutathione lyase